MDQNTLCACRIVSKTKCRITKKVSLYHLGFSNEQTLLYYLHDLDGQIQGRSVRCDINIYAVKIEQSKRWPLPTFTGLMP